MDAGIRSGSRSDFNIHNVTCYKLVAVVAVHRRRRFIKTRHSVSGPAASGRHTYDVREALASSPNT